MGKSAVVQLLRNSGAQTEGSEDSQVKGSMINSESLLSWNGQMEKTDDSVINTTLCIST